jgi:hypothetical protein
MTQEVVTSRGTLSLYRAGSKNAIKKYDYPD